MTRCDNGSRVKFGIGDKLAFFTPAAAIVAALIALYSRLAVVETRVEQLTHEIQLLREQRGPRLAAIP